jgi:phosphohistidine phosphatase
VIWLLRHGHAADGSPDAERPLTDKGKAQSRAAGAALKALGIELSACLTSPKVRARDTAVLACNVAGAPEPQIEHELAGGPFDALTLALGNGEHVLLVGHDPDFSHAVRALTGASVKMKKGGLAGIEDGELKVLLRPAELSAIAGHD